LDDVFLAVAFFGVLFLTVVLLGGAFFAVDFLREAATFDALELVFFAVLFAELRLLVLRAAVFFPVFLPGDLFAAGLRAVVFLALLLEDFLAPDLFAVVRFEVFLAGFLAGLMGAGR
jgi:hypothetical protein